MAWYPGKNVDKVKRGAAQVAEKAKRAEAAVRDHAPSRDQAVGELREAYRRAEEAFVEAKAEVEDALRDRANVEMFAKKAEEDAREHKALIELLAQAAREFDVQGFKRLSSSLLGPGTSVTAAEAQAQMTTYATSSPAWVELAETAWAELTVLSIGAHTTAEAGLCIQTSGFANPVPPLYRFDRSEWIPYPYREVVGGIGATVAVDVGLVAGAFRGRANDQSKLFMVVSGHAGDPVGLNVDLSYGLPEADLDGVSVGLNAGLGLPLGELVGIGFTAPLLAEYLLGTYD